MKTTPEEDAAREAEAAAALNQTGSQPAAAPPPAVSPDTASPAPAPAAAEVPPTSAPKPPEEKKNDPPRDTRGKPDFNARPGRDGNPGAKGEAGKPGEPGKAGMNGKDGEKGDRGPAGPCGVDAPRGLLYLALALGFVAIIWCFGLSNSKVSVVDFNAALKTIGTRFQTMEDADRLIMGEVSGLKDRMQTAEAYLKSVSKTAELTKMDVAEHGKRISGLAKKVTTVTEAHNALNTRVILVENGTGFAPDAAEKIRAFLAKQ
ncbi:MAG: hypothetical protein Q8R29_03555 [bacterium]|nr:hypothetical protein [bacterium]